MKFTTAFLILLLLITFLALAFLLLNPGVPSPIPDPHPSAKIISIASAPLIVKGLICLIVLIFGVTSLATFWRPNFRNS